MNRELTAFFHTPPTGFIRTGTKLQTCDRGRERRTLSLVFFARLASWATGPIFRSPGSMGWEYYGEASRIENETRQALLHVWGMKKALFFVGLWSIVQAFQEEDTENLFLLDERCILRLEKQWWSDNIVWFFFTRDHNL